MASEKELTARVEEYLESMVNLITEGKAVIAARLAERLGLTPATVSAAIQRMARDGLIGIREDKEIYLTEKGKKAALAVLRRHRLAERLLYDVLGIEWHEVHDEACVLEHAISAKVEERLNKVLNHPTVCPHGNPIPEGDSLPSPKGVPLTSVTSGTTAVVERITEEAARKPELMEYLYRTGIIPGIILTIERIDSYAGTIVLSIGNRQVTLGLQTSDMIWVTPHPSS